MHLLLLIEESNNIADFVPQQHELLAVHNIMYVLLT